MLLLPCPKTLIGQYLSDKKDNKLLLIRSLAERASHDTYIAQAQNILQAFFSKTMKNNEKSVKRALKLYIPKAFYYNGFTNLHCDFQDKGCDAE